MDNNDHYTPEFEDLDERKPSGSPDPASYDYGGSYQYDQSAVPPPPGDDAPSGFASASLVLGILSLVLGCCFYVSIPLGGLGILFAILSKKSADMEGRAKAGLGLSIAGLVLSILLTIVAVFSFVVYSTRTGMSMEEYMDQYFREIYGEEAPDVDSDLLEDYLRDNGIDLDDTL